MDTQASHFFKEMNAYFFDLDGCIYHGDMLDRGAKQLLELLHEHGKKTFFITNNSRQTRSEIADKLNQMGLSIQPDQILTATDYVNVYVREKYGSVTVTIVGSDSLARSFQDNGFRVLPIHAEEYPEVVVIGRDTAFTYDKLQLIVEAQRQGAQIISVNPDMCHPGANGVRVPETGALVAALEAMIGREIPSFGKPAPYLFQYGMELCGEEPQHCVMVGDNLLTDIAGGSCAGMNTVWIRLNQDPALVESHCSAGQAPTFIVDNMKQLASLYDKGGLL